MPARETLMKGLDVALMGPFCCSPVATLEATLSTENEPAFDGNSSSGRELRHTPSCLPLSLPSDLFFFHRLLYLSA